ncbi:cupin domain-containing protein [Rubripirellula sp.]|nr:cupin domain-containing protein [Rubripirellula sp.]MDB4621943.1 cupin domain-containing protein [Rubripirellula sp.]
MSEVVDPKKIAGKLKAFWSPRIVAEVDDAFVKVAKIQGEFEWHSHADEDEMFIVLDGEMSIQMEDRTVNLRAGQLFVVPRGKRHRPVAAKECLILLVERNSTEHMGELVQDKTRSIADQWIQE